MPTRNQLIVLLALLFLGAVMSAARGATDDTGPTDIGNPGQVFRTVAFDVGSVKP